MAAPQGRAHREPPRGRGDPPGPHPSFDAGGGSRPLPRVHRRMPGGHRAVPELQPAVGFRLTPPDGIPRPDHYDDGAIVRTLVLCQLLVLRPVSSPPFRLAAVVAAHRERDL